MKPSSCAFLSLAFLAACASLQGSTQRDQETQDIQMADNLKRAGDITGAVQVLRQAQIDHPDNPVILSQLGYALIADGQPREAAGIFSQLIALHPDDVSAYNGKAVAIDRSGRHLAAQKVYRQALKLSPDNISIKNNLAMSMILNNQAGEAIVLLEELNRQTGGNQTVRQNLALAYGLEGDRKKALELNLQDLPEAEAKENLRFYEQYAMERRKLEENGLNAPSDAAEDAMFDKPSPAADATPSYPNSLDDLLASTTKDQQKPEQDKTVKRDSAAPAAAAVPATAPSSTPAIAAAAAYPSAGKQSQTVLPTAAPVSATPAAQKRILPAAAPQPPADSGQSRLEINPKPVAEATPRGANPLQGVLPATAAAAAFTPAPSAEPVIASPASLALGEQLQALVPTASGSERLIAPNAQASASAVTVTHVKHRHRRKRPEPQPIEPVPQPQPSFLGMRTSAEDYTYPSQSRR